jgi:hypothetical protein
VTVGEHLPFYGNRSTSQSGWGSKRGRVDNEPEPQGALMAVVAGDASKPGRFTVLLSMPDGCRMPPHFQLAASFLPCSGRGGGAAAERSICAPL